MITKNRWTRPGLAAPLFFAIVCLFAPKIQAQHSLLGHYAFDTADAQNHVQAFDSSTNHNDMTFGAGGSGGGVFVTSDSAAGPLAVQFVSTGPGSEGALGWAPTPPSIVSAIQTSFTISCWI